MLRVAVAHRDGKRFPVRIDEMLTAFMVMVKTLLGRRSKRLVIDFCFLDAPARNFFQRLIDDRRANTSPERSFLDDLRVIVE